MKKQSIITLSVLASFLASVQFGNPCLADDSSQAKEFENLVQAFRSDPIWQEKRGEPAVNAFRRDYAQKAWAIATANPQSELGLSALIWLLAIAPADFDRPNAIKIIEKDYFKSDKLGALGWSLSAPPHTAEKEQLLTRLMNESPHESVRAQALYGLALAKMSSDRELSEKLFTQVTEKYASVQAAQPANNVRFKPFALGEGAQKKLFELQHLSVGAQALPIAGTDADGKPLKLEDFRGKIVMLHFFGSWCGICRSMFPDERSLVQQFKSEPFVLLGVAADPPDKLKKMIDEDTVQWPCISDGDQKGPIAKEWQVHSWPTVYILDDKGVIRFANPPGHAPKELSTRISQLLALMKH